ncbi:stress responsive A/B barrel domain-containing protein [Mycena alexandri]|uniref:Stress responsive A/B barrel domain-containing protein n=1 Tax=Mycena alexandri TaxID=1745969 RepID=A0AAD6SNR6_9AGAR|nr:stress responsive A/B barrel domain-containing protein [Mycena alexandri]
MPGLVHIVMFAFEPLATPEEVQGVCDRLLALKENCLHPQTNKPYLKTSYGGKNNSPEGLNGDFTHAFVMEFGTEEDRDYYLREQGPGSSGICEGPKGHPCEGSGRRFCSRRILSAVDLGWSPKVVDQQLLSLSIHTRF